jgi:hypothetical protein
MVHSERIIRLCRNIFLFTNPSAKIIHLNKLFNLSTDYQNKKSLFFLKEYDILGVQLRVVSYKSTTI